MSSTTNAQPPSGEGGDAAAKTKEVAPPPPPGFEDVKAGAHLDEVAEVAEKLAKGENLGTKKEGTVDAPDASLKTGKLNWAEEVGRRRSTPSSVDALCRRFFLFKARFGLQWTTKNWRSDRMVFKNTKDQGRASIDERIIPRVFVGVLIFSLSVCARAVSFFSRRRLKLKRSLK